MKKLLIAGFVVIVLFSCSKDKYQTTPQISIKSISSKVIPVNGSLNIVLSFTDKQGDVRDSLFMKKIRLNKTVVPTVRDSLKFKIPDFPDSPKGEISIALDYTFHLVSAQTPPPVVGSNPARSQPDTLNIQMWVRDKGGHISDTVSTGQIVVITQ